MSGFAIGALTGVISEEFSISSVETPHGTEIGLSVGATVCTLGIIGYILRRKMLIKQINKLEKEQKKLLKKYDQAKTKSKGDLIK